MEGVAEFVEECLDLIGSEERRGVGDWLGEVHHNNKLKAAKYSFDEEALRPYFELSKVVDGVFGLANKLYWCLPA